MNRKKRRIGKGIGIALLVAAMAVVAIAVFRGLRAENGTYAQTVETTRNVTQTATRPQAALANWTPAAWPENRNAALLSSLNIDDALALAAQGFQSVVLPDPFATGAADKAGEVLNALADADVFSILTVTPVGGEGLDTFGAALGELIRNSSFDALLLADNAGKDADGTLTTAFTSTLNKILEEARLSLPIIFDVGELTKTTTVYQEAMSLLAGSLEKAELLAHSSADKAKQLPQLAAQLAGDVPVNALFDLKTAIPNGSLRETVEFLSALESVQDIPLVLESADLLPKNKEAAGLLQKLYQGTLDLINAAKNLGMSKPFKNLKSSQDVHTDKPTVTFTGTSSPLFALTCNGKDVTRNESGDFSVDMPLQAGKNVFKFEHQGKTYVVNIYYDVSVLDSVTPRGSLETTGGIEMVVGAVARRGSTVTAKLGPQSITLQPGSAGEADGVNADSEKDSDFISYTGTFKLPASDSKLVVGTLRFTATFQGLSESMSGALVTVLPEVIITPPTPETTTASTTATTAEPDSSTASASTTDNTTTTGGAVKPSADSTTTAGVKPSADTTTTAAPTTTTTTTTSESTAKPAAGLRTPYSNNGLGTAQMIEVTGSWAPARWSNTTDTQYNPTASPLLAGSFDYVTGKQVIDGTTYYLLGSGKRLKAIDLKVIDQGYRLPSNALRASSSVSGGTLVMRFGIDWKIPFQVDLIGQKYTAMEGFNGNDYGITNFNATGLEIVFYHTANYSGSVNVGSSVISGAQWSRDTAKNTVTLKLTFNSAGKFYGWQAYYDGGELVIRLRPKPPSSLSGAVIWIDPGHGGSDPGAPYVVSHATLKHEKFVNIIIANKLKAKLEAAGATVYMTRTGDSYVSPGDRVRMTRQRSPDMFISLHTDSTTTASPSGTSAFYYRAFSKPLAKAIHERIVETYKKNIYIPFNGISNYSEMLSKLDRGTKYYPFEVTRIEECPAILLEYGFSSNLTECRVLQTEKYQDLFAQATADGIADWLRAQ